MGMRTFSVVLIYEVDDDLDHCIRLRTLLAVSHGGAIHRQS